MMRKLIASKKKIECKIQLDDRRRNSRENWSVELNTHGPAIYLKGGPERHIPVAQRENFLKISVRPYQINEDNLRINASFVEFEYDHCCSSSHSYPKASITYEERELSRNLDYPFNAMIKIRDGYQLNLDCKPLL